LRHTAAIGAEVEKLSQALEETNRFIRELLEMVQNADLTYAQMMEMLNRITESVTTNA